MLTRKEMIADFNERLGRDPTPEEWQAYNAEKERLVDKCRDTEFFHNLAETTDSKYMSMGLGVHEGQAGRISFKTGKGHGTSGALHLAVSEDGKKITFAFEHEPGVEVEQLRTIVRPPWRFYDFWRHVKAEHDNVIRDESEWPVLEELIEFPEGSGTFYPKSEVATALRQAMNEAL